MSTGVVVGTYSDTEPFRLAHAFQIEGGVEGFLRRVAHSTITDKFSGSYGETYFSVGSLPLNRGDSYVGWYDDSDEEDCDFEFVAEKFTARGSGNPFAYRTSALEPLRIEGAMLALGFDPVWQSPQQMYFMIPPKFKGNKMSAAHKWLRDNDLYVAPKEVGCKDANDVRSAILHAIAFLRNKKHMPTLKHYFGGKDGK